MTKSPTSQHRIDLQSNYPKPLAFPKNQIKAWALAALANEPASEFTLRWVDNDEMQMLNHQYRNKNAPTNVLAFPSELPAYIKQKRRFLGDIIIAPDVLFAEHLQQERPLDAHWAHIIIHGVLHLLGHTHEEPEPTARMQSLECQYLAQFQFPNPYALEHHEPLENH